MANHSVRILAEGNSHIGGVDGSGLVKSINWKQGVIIAMGVPILILPGIYDIAGTAWALSILIWTVSVLQGFLQNLAIGEMAATLETPGIGGCAQKVFTKPEQGRYGIGRFAGAFTAWAYWFTWTPVIPIFTCTLVTYVTTYLDKGLGITIDSGLPTLALQLLFGVIIFSAIIMVGSKGLGGGAKLGLILALIAIIPLLVVVIMPVLGLTVGGNVAGVHAFSIDRIMDTFTPPGWNWGAHDILMVFGMFAYAQWCACAWESVATYGAEYKDPGKDLPKGLIYAGLICLCMYFLVPTVVFGMMDMSQGDIDLWGVATLYPIAQFDFGEIGLVVALILFIAAMVMLIQTAFLGSSRTLYFMGHEGNMPKFFTKTNENGAPIYAMFFQFAMGIIFIIIIHFGSVGMILAASSFGFSFALGMGMLAFVTARRDPRFKDIPRPYRAPKGWYYVACGLMVYQFFILIPCLAYWCINGGIENGTFSVVIGAVILLLYVPLWLCIQKMDERNDQRCYVCRKTKADYNTWIIDDRHLDNVERDDKLEEIDDFAVVLIGNAYVPLCPVCYNMIIGNPQALYNKNKKFAQSLQDETKGFAQDLHDENKKFTEDHLEKN